MDNRWTNGGERRLVGVASRIRNDEERLDEIEQTCGERETAGECVEEGEPEICRWSEAEDRCTRSSRVNQDPTMAVVGTEYARVDAYLEWLDEVLEERPADQSDSSTDDEMDEPESSCSTAGNTSGGLVAVALLMLVAAVRGRRSPERG